MNVIIDYLIVFSFFWKMNICDIILNSYDIQTTQKVSKIEIGAMNCTWCDPQNNGFHVGFENIYIMK